MPFHTIRFDELGNPVTPEGVDAAEWQMELPSILGLAWTGCRDSDMEVVSVASDAVSLANSCGEDLAAEHQVNASNKARVGAALQHTGLGDVASLDAVMPHIALDVTYQQACAGRPSAWNVPSAEHTYVLDPVPFSETTVPDHQAELFSMRMLRRGHLNMCDFQTLLGLLAGECASRKRKCVSSDFGTGARASFAAGAFVQGGIGGVLRCTRTLPWTVRLLVAVVRGCCYNHRFNAVALHRNTFMAMHTDSHNAKGFPNLVLPCSRWLGGGLWLAEAETAYQGSQADASTLGKVLAVRFPYVLFDPLVPHGTQLWDGERIILVAYAVRDIGLLSEADTQFLAGFGFTVSYGDAWVDAHGATTASSCH